MYNSAIWLYLQQTYPYEKWYLYNYVDTIFVQLYIHTHIMFLFSLFLFPSLLFLTNEKREQQSCLKGCTKMVVKISILYTYSVFG